MGPGEEIDCRSSFLEDQATCEARGLVSEGEIINGLLKGGSLGMEILNLRTGRLRSDTASQTLFPSFEEILRPALRQAGGTPLTTAPLGNALLTAQTFQDNADRLFRRSETAILRGSPGPQRSG